MSVIFFTQLCLLSGVCWSGFTERGRNLQSGMGWACSIRFVGWGLLVLVYLVGLQSGVCKVGFANWVRFVRLGLLNHVCWVGIYGLGSLGGGKSCTLRLAMWGLWSGFYNVEFVGWGLLGGVSWGGAIRWGLLGGINWVGWAGLVYWIEFAGSDEICWVGV